LNPLNILLQGTAQKTAPPLSNALCGKNDMKKPSKLMPKYYPKGYGLLGKIIALIIAIIIVVFFCIGIWQEPYFFLIILLVIIPLVWISGYFEEKKRKKKLSMMAAKREGCDIGTFAKTFDYRKIDTWIIRAVYEELQEFVSTKEIQLPILATDHLEKDLNIYEEDLNDLMEAIAQRTGRTFDDYEKNPFYSNLNAVSDLVGYFNYQPLGNKDAQQMAQQQTS
jgi:hypothetical protein